MAHHIILIVLYSPHIFMIEIIQLFTYSPNIATDKVVSIMNTPIEEMELSCQNEISFSC